MTTLILSVIFGVLFFLLSTVGYFEKHPKLLQNTALFSVIITLCASISDLVGISFIAYHSPFLSFRNYEHCFILLMNVCLLYFLAQNHIYMRSIKRPLPEQIALLYFMMTGGIILTAANHLLLLFLGIEIMSLPLYVFTGLHKKNVKSNEATLKYFLIGAFFTGILLMGITLIYGSTGSFQLSELSADLYKKDALQIIGITFILGSFAFKVAVVPFHFWTPDVYEGAPTMYAGLMASISKSFFFIAFIKVFHQGFAANYDLWRQQIILLILLTLVVSNVIALYQSGIKRLMSYSSIAQAAFMLFAFVGNNGYAFDGLLIYALSYSLAVLGIFAIIHPISDKPIEHLNGLFKTQPLSAIALAVFLFSLIGIPLTGGFIGKYYMLLAANTAHIYVWLIVIAFGASAVSAYYYLRILNCVFFKNPTELAIPLSFSKRFETLLLLNALILLFVGIHPSWILQLLSL